ncbi:DUF1800 domain-containing protein [Tenacibaculum amylolyticum]|uniref:DUF1800 domain-containing protein n=1 Tax=Tenacibaculum amylolyticum TaxID=104269 RepID=UPI003892F38A
MNTTHILHLYNRIGFGIIPKELNKLQHKEKHQIVDDLFSSSTHFSPLEIDVNFLTKLSKTERKSKKRELIKKSRKKIREYNLAWLNRLFNPTELLREKMTLFWANHFVCEDKNILYVQRYNNTLRKHALGNFGDFVKAISKEPAMLKYLNNKQNKKKNPNENFARELMELFMLGQGNYTETDIKESAKAFTGYNHNFNGKFIIRPRHHNTSEKLFFGQQGNFNGDDIIDIILEQKQCARFICEKIYQYFVNDTINKEHINEMTTVFYGNYNIEKLMKHMLLSDWFYASENIGTKIKSPIEFLVGMNTIVPYKMEKPKQSMLLQKLLGQILLNPPNVAGWKGGKSWIDSNTIVTRLRLPSVLLNNAEIHYSDKGDFEDSNTNFSEKKLRKKAFIKTITNWDVFNKNYKGLTNKELISNILVSPISIGTKNVLNVASNIPQKEFCVQLLSLPEYQLC